MIYQFEDFELDTGRMELRQNHTVQNIEPQVFRLLTLLIANNDRVLSKDEIIDQIWDGRIISESAFSSRVASARAAIGDDGKQQRLIRTSHGTGFRFVGEYEIKAETAVETRSNRTDASTSNGQEQPVSKRPSIAVLPFDNMSKDADQDYLADGMCEDIITVLSKVPGLLVVSRNSTFTYKGKNLDIRQIGKELNAAFVLEGSVRRQGDMIRVTGQLIGSGTGHHLWADRFDRKLDDIFKLQDEMTREIVSALQINLTEGERAKLWYGRTPHFKAWEKQVQSPPLINTQEQAKVLQGRQLSHEALYIDPDYAEAWAAIGISHFVEGLGGWGDPTEVSMTKSVDALAKALALDDQHPTALVGMGLAQVATGDYETGYEMARQAYALAPNSSEIASLFALVSLYCGEYDELERLLQDAMSYFPIFPAWYSSVLACHYLIQHEPQKAVDAALVGANIASDFLQSYPMQAIAYVRLGQQEKASEAVRNILKINPRYTAGSFARSRLFKDKALLDQFVKDLHRAGLPS